MLRTARHVNADVVVDLDGEELFQLVFILLWQVLVDHLNEAIRVSLKLFKGLPGEHIRDLPELVQPSEAEKEQVLLQRFLQVRRPKTRLLGRVYKVSLTLSNLVHEISVHIQCTAGADESIFVATGRY